MSEEINTQNESSLNLLLGIKFSLLKCKLDAMYRKGEDKHTILLMPQEMEDNEDVSVAELVEGIVGMVKKANGGQAPASLEEDLNGKLKESFEGKDSFKNIRIALRMLYLYIEKGKEETKVEYAFRLDVVTKDVIPEGVRNFIDVECLTLALWNTGNKQITQKMNLYDPVRQLES